MTKIEGLTPQQKRELLEQLLRQRAERSTPPDEFPMSLGQQGLWYAYQRDPQTTTYNVCLPSRFRSRIDLDALRESVQRLVDRHRCLRTVFDEDSETLDPIQRVVERSTPEFREVDADQWDDQQLREAVLAESQRPFDLSQGPLLRVAVFRVAEDHFVIAATSHHIVVDFWSLVLMMDEVGSLYQSVIAKSANELPPAPGNFSRFVESQTALIASPEGERLAEYWAKQIASTRPVLEWPTDYRRPARFTHRAGVQSIPFSAGTAEKVSRLSRRLNVTPNVVLMAMLQVLVARQTSQHSFAIGTPFSGRLDREFEKTVGFFVNMLPIVADLSGAPTLEQLIRTVGDTMVDALQHEALPFSEIVRRNAPGRDASRHPLFQVSCTFEKAQIDSQKGRAGFLLNPDSTNLDFAGLRQESFFVPHPTCHYDVEFIFEILDDAVSGMICYCSDLFSGETIQSMSQHFVSLIDAMLADPTRCVLTVPWGETVVADQFDACDSGDDTIGECLSGKEHRILLGADQLAKKLVDSGIQSGEVIPVCARRGSHAWIGILGVMFAGGVVVPVDAEQPCVSFYDLVSDVSARFVIVDTLGEGWVSDDSVERIELENGAWQKTAHDTRLSDKTLGSHRTRNPVSGNDLAYIVYTSGSTGKPKGVPIQHRGICSTLRWRKKAGTLREEDRVLILVSHQFDAALAVVLSTLHHGATPVWPRDPSHLDLDDLVDLIIQERITILPAVPSLLRSIAQHPRFGECNSIRAVWSGGESMSSQVLKMIRKHRDLEYWNFYGPSEAAVEVTAKCVGRVDDRQDISIGTAIDGVQIFMLDDRLQPVPSGVFGQIAIAGRGLSPGYVNRPELTRQSFIDSEFILHSDGTPARLYLTGDRGRMRHDGDLEFRGRLDHQVKVRGFRIELEEVERTIEHFEFVVRAAVCVVFAGTPGESLAAYLEVDPEFQVDALRRYLAKQLPSYKRPQTIRILDRLPTGSSGKVARDRLPIPSSKDQQQSFVEPKTELETFLCQRLAASLDLEQMGATANFFESGGTSLQAALLTSRLSNDLKLSIPTSLLFDLGDARTISTRLVALYESEMLARFGPASVEFAHAERESECGHSLLAHLKSDGCKAPVFMIHPPGGIVVCYREIARQLDDRPLIAIRSRGLHGEERLPQTMSEMAADYVDAIESIEGVDHYVIGGWSLGGVIAYEVTRQLILRGHSVEKLVLLDSTVPDRSDEPGVQIGKEYGIELTLRQLGELTDDQQLPMLYEHAERLGVLEHDTPREVIDKVLEDLRRLFAHHVQLSEAYSLQPLDVSVLLLRPTETPQEADSRPDRGWGRWVKRVNVKTVSGHHHSMVQSPGAAQIAALLS